MRAVPLQLFSPAVQAWFESSFPAPTPAQEQGWPAIHRGDSTLILAPTGSGKTLAAFLAAINRLMTSPVTDPKQRRTRVLYISPLRALAFDVEKNLRSPLVGIRMAAERLGIEITVPTVAMRTGDTSMQDRRRLARVPADILITTPESLYLMLTSKARETLAGVETVIIDEIHALAPTKRGAHMALSMERLDALVTGAGNPPVQRIGLSATQRPLEEVARFLGGFDTTTGRPRPVTIVDAGVRKQLDIEVVVPVDDMSDLGEARSLWPSIHPKLLELVMTHRSTLIFANSRRSAERLAAALNELAFERGIIGPGDPDLVKAHHGSLAREQRVVIEDELKTGQLRGLVATSSLELGIDMGAIDLVVQVESPGAVSSGLQRIGRAGHQVGEPSRGKVFPKHRGDLVETAVVVQRMRAGLIEHTHYLRNPLDVLSQHLVAMTAMDEYSVHELMTLTRRCACFADITNEVFVAVLDMLAGRYPSDEFAELRPRLNWDRLAVDSDGEVRLGLVRARDGAQRLAIANAGTIPDRGLFGVFLPDGVRVGELDEEMVYESRTGEVFRLGASTWRIEEITHERVVVTPAPGVPGKMPFWHGDRPGRPIELGTAVGAFVREIRAMPADDAVARMESEHCLDGLAARNLLQYLNDQAIATGVVPDDRTIVVERFRDEIGDWRVCILTPFGAAVHAPWGMAIEANMRAVLDVAVETIWGDDGIVMRLPDSMDRIDNELFTIDPSEIDELVVSAVSQSALFASRFREASARALLLPRRRPGMRTPLWQQRQRSSGLLDVASKYPTFPMLLEATRECLHDVFDLDALRNILADIRARRIKLVAVETPTASPFSQSLVFSWIAAFMYEYDAPNAERKAAALALDRDLLRELLGSEELRELLEPAVLNDVEAELQCISELRHAVSVDGLHDILRRVGDLSMAEISARSTGDFHAWIGELVLARRAIVVRIDGHERYVDAQDAGRLRDALGVAIPVGLPFVFTESTPRPLDDLVGRFARTHGPFHTVDLATRFGASTERVTAALEALERAGRIVSGDFRPGGVAREWCDADVLRLLRRRSLAALRKEVEPVDATVLGLFLPAWHGIDSPRRGTDALVDAIAMLQGVPLAVSALATEILPARVADFKLNDLDALFTSGTVVWQGAGGLGSNDGKIVLAFRGEARLVLPQALEYAVGDIASALREHLGMVGASFWNDLVRAAHVGGHSYTDSEVLGALWNLVWAGEVTNDGLAPVWAYASGAVAKAAVGARSAARRPRPGGLARLGPASGHGRWSLTSALRQPPSSNTERMHALISQLLERHGVLTREAVLAEGIEGGFHGIYPVLSMMEERGQVRRGYFIAGMGAAQFALPGAVDRLRSYDSIDRSTGVAGPGVVSVLSAVDPAQPYGASVPWPTIESTASKPMRVAGALVMLLDGNPLVYLDRRGTSVVTFGSRNGQFDWPSALTNIVKSGRRKSLSIERIDGVAAPSSPHADALRSVGFTDGYKGLAYRAS